jgi:hypothetical protein
MSNIIYPRSPRETMDGWSYLPRYLDKIRLHLAGKLHADYQENFGQGFDGMWLKYAGVTHEQMIEVVKKSITDGEVCDWVRKNVKKSPAEKAAHAQDVLSRPRPTMRRPSRGSKCARNSPAWPTATTSKPSWTTIDADEKRLYIWATVCPAGSAG